jgi:hypothetical protein
MQQHTGAISLQIPAHHTFTLLDLLREYPSLRYMRKGWAMQDFVIYGPAPDIADLAARLPAWEHQEVAQDAW